MGTETVQLLATCFTLDRLSQNDCPKTKTGKSRGHFNPKHPSAIWTRQSKSNMLWLIDHCEAIFQEKYRRYPNGGRHFSHDFLDWVKENLNDSNVNDGDETELLPAIADGNNCKKVVDKFDSLPIVTRYRLYMKLDKAYATWKQNRPDWMDWSIEGITSGGDCNDQKQALELAISESKFKTC